ncbi:glutamyl-trna synthetase [Ophiostoma piceae UAMH 11346]|uniref:Glutamate--tRNA ligase, mitochondrial n=1 Tax=Ophiostoma piceae (strain UAMH 11346) TaxID=1262450 RepID=S3BSP2_OPHP1|nr:glutamyl-trna synthetase [Ophiostoma piceae UAMH 11346]
MNTLTMFGRPACLSCRARIVTLVRVRYCSSTPTRSGSAGTPTASSLTSRRPGRATRTRLPDKPARTRFAPSPTGYLHLGSLRTALYNYLLARATNGQFILRLEDTDQSRIVSDAEDRLYKDLEWSGLVWDEGPDRGGPYGPYKQSERLHIYHEYADRLVEERKAFRCFCSQDDLATHHQKALDSDGTFGTYPGMCLSISEEEANDRAAQGEAHTIRFRSSPDPVPVNDIVYGLYKKRLPEDHFIIMKSDGFPTYHFANVVDDHLMDITHVVRGAEWLISTAKHVSLYDAFGWQAPQFAHVGLLVDTNRQKLSKRNMDIGIDSYQRDAIPPPALLNFAALLGWNPGSLSNKGVMTLDDMTSKFDLKFTKGDIIVNMEKLAFFHKKHIRLALDDPSPENKIVEDYLTIPVAREAAKIESLRAAKVSTAASESATQDETGPSNYVASLGKLLLQLPSLGSSKPDTGSSGAHERIRAMLRISRSEAVAAPGIVEANKFLIWQPADSYIQASYPRLSETLHNVRIEEVPKSIPEVLDFFIDRFSQIDNGQWTAKTVQQALDVTVKLVVDQEEGKKPTAAGYKYLRWALLGLDNGPQMHDLVEYLGKSETIRRIQLARSIASSPY